MSDVESTTERDMRWFESEGYIHSLTVKAEAFGNTYAFSFRPDGYRFVFGEAEARAFGAGFTAANRVRKEAA